MITYQCNVGLRLSFMCSIYVCHFSTGHTFDEFMSNKKFGRDERLSHGQTSSDSNKNIYHGSSNTWERRNGRGDDDERNGVGDRYFLSGSDFSTKISSQHFFPLKLLFHILTVVLVTYTLT